MKKTNTVTLRFLIVLLGALAPLWLCHAQSTFFSDNFSNGSTINANPPVYPTLHSTSYEFLSSLTPAYTNISPNDLQFGLTNTGGGNICELQALFSTSQIALVQPGDYIQLTVIYTNTSGIWGAPLGTAITGFSTGLYNSSQVLPLGGGLVGTEGNGAAASGGAAGWEGYTVEVGNNSASPHYDIYSRPAQTGTANNNQDVTSQGSSSKSYTSAVVINNPGGNTGNGVFPPVTTNMCYTNVLNITLLSSDPIILAVTNTLFNSTGLVTITNGLTTNGVSSSFTTAGFDAFAIGFYKKTDSSPSNVVDISSITISGSVSAISGPPLITTEPTPAIVATNGYAQFSVGASGFDMNYQWYLNGAPLANAGTYSGAKTSTLVISPAVATNAAASADGYYCIVTGAGDYSTNTVTNSLTLVEATNLVWVGTESGGNWDVDTTADWETTNSPASAAVFTGGDPVSFNDASALNGDVTLAGNVGPSSISVTTANAFDFGGSGSIVGPGYAVFDGENAPGEVELNVNNTYTGGTLFTNGIYVYLENYNGLGDGPVILGSSSAEMEIVNAGGATTGVNGNIDIVSNCEFLIDGTGTYAGVFFGNLSGSSSATLTFEPSSAGTPEGNGSSTNRMRLYGTGTVCNANIFIDGPSTPEAQYNGDEIAFYNASGSQVYNGVISGNGGVISRGSGIAILNGQNTFAGGTTPTAGVIGVGASSIGTPGNVTSGPLGTGVLLLAPEVPSITATGIIISSGGSNNIGNTIEYPSGTNNLTLEVGGTNSLTFSGPFGLNGADGLITNTITNRIVDVTNTALTTFSGVISDGGLGYGFTLTGSGVLALNNSETYSGPTVISGGTLLVNGQIGTNSVTVATKATLGGSGTVTGAVTIQSGGTLAAGNQAIGTLSINNTLTFLTGSTDVVDVSQSGGNSEVSGLTSVTYAGTLAPNIVSGTLSAGQDFTIFSAAAHSGNFSAIAGTPGAGLAWEFDSTNGVLSVVTSGPIVPTIPPRVTGFSLSGGTVTITATNGVNGGTYYLLGTTNVATPIGQWVPVATNVVTASGGTESFTFAGTNAYTVGSPMWFFMLSSTNN